MQRRLSIWTKINGEMADYKRPGAWEYNDLNCACPPLPVLEAWGQLELNAHGIGNDHALVPSA